MNGDISRRMPYSLEAEQSLLGSVMIDPSCMDDIAGLMTAEDFYMPEHGEIYRAMQSMYTASKNDFIQII